MKRVLVVEDEPVVRMLIEASLLGQDCQVASVADGLLACESVTESAPDLILLDLGLPGMSGPDVLRHLRADAATASIPVLMLTGGEPPEDLYPDGVLRKPFTPALLRESVASFFSSPST